MSNKPNILIVDDEPFNLDYLEQELEDADYETVRAGNGQEALNIVASQPPDLILLDIMMPGMDGFEVLSRLKADTAWRDIPVVVISASKDLPSVVRGIQLGAEDYLPKPFEPVLLRARISSSLEKKRLHDIERLYLQGLEREMDLAREIQQGFLPPELPQSDGWQVAAYFKAAREVAGDFYDAFLLNDGSLVCVIGDVCGKGVGAALFMTLFRSLIRATFTTQGFQSGEATNPGQWLRHVVSSTNRYVAETHGDANMFATVFVGVISPQYGILNYINCGHEPPLWAATGGHLTALRPTGPAVGAILDAVFTVKEIRMEPGDLLLAFTDGVTDALNCKDEFFGKDCLPALLDRTDRDPEALLNDIQAELTRFVGEAEQFDDITMIAVGRRSRPEKL
jgi:serine phosphatase RsbU (regulator of sigma subunit)